MRFISFTEYIMPLKRARYLFLKMTALIHTVCQQQSKVKLFCQNTNTEATYCKELYGHRKVLTLCNLKQIFC